MRGGRILGIALTVAIAASGAILADEVVHFTNGTFMPIRSHVIEGNMVRVVLGAESEMAFPIGMVERIESGGRDIVLSPLSANIVTSSPATGGGAATGAVENTRTYAVTGALSPAGTALERSKQNGSPTIAAPGVGMAGLQNAPPEARAGNTTRPFSNSGHPVKRQMSITGDRTLRSRNSVGAGSKESLRGGRLSPGGSDAAKDKP